MKRNLLLLSFMVFYVLQTFSQTLYTSTLETGTRFVPGNGSAGTPIVVFDDVLIPSALVQGSDSISITKVKFGIRRLAAAPAITLNFYYTTVDDTTTMYNTFIRIPPVLIGTMNLPAIGASPETTIVSLGDSVNALFKVKTDTGGLYTGFQTFFPGVSFTGADPGTLNGWRLTTPGSPNSDNDAVMWFYDNDAAVKRSAHIFNGSTSATFYMEVFGKGLNVVPVTLADFTARRSGKVNELNWSTQQELNTSHFVVEHSADGRNFNAIGQVTANGNTSSVRTYHYTDVSPARGINYYRLRITDKDSKAKLSATRSVRNSGLADLSIYPNPVRDNLNLMINADQKASGQLTVTDPAGTLLYSRMVQVPQGTSRLTIPVESLAAGTYLLKLGLDDDVIVKPFTRQ